jgi:hypothetical protein
MVANTDSIPSLAEVGLAALTKEAGPTIQRGIHTNSVPWLNANNIAANGDDRAGKLVSRDHRVYRRGKLAIENMNISPADPACSHLNDHVFFRCHGLGN